jgi:Inner membrane component of T3SS, cytoplasmic domain
MNWKKVALRALRWKVLALGAAAGLWGSLLHESMLLLPRAGQGPLAHALLAGAALGLGLGLFLAPADALLHRQARRALRSALAGAVLGGVLGAAGSAAQFGLLRVVGGGAPWLSAQLVPWAGLALTLGLVGAGCGLAAGMATGRGRRALRLAWRAGLAGTLLALPLAAATSAAAWRSWAVLAALVAWSALLALVLHWGERRSARRWLRLLTGPNEDSIFPLRGPQITLGKHERNDIPLQHFQEIFPYHCELRWAADHYDVVDNEQGGVVLVNYRQVQEHPLRPGDLIKIGSALLQYGEAS